jgi:hypothetical protein
MALNNRAVLVHVTISQWRGRYVDDNVANEVAAKYGVQDTYDSYVKNLLPPAAFQAIRRNARDIRDFISKNTLPWQDNGIRVLPSKSYLKFMTQLSSLRDDFDRSVQLFVDNYPRWVEHAKQSKKGLFDETQYPSQQGLKNHFGVELNITPFPEVEDFRIDSVSENDMEALREQARASVGSAMDKASQALITRIRDRVQLLHQALKTPSRSVFETTVTAVPDMANLANDLNINDDPEVTFLANAVISTMQDVSADKIRLSSTFRREIADKLNVILANSGVKHGD